MTVDYKPEIDIRVLREKVSRAYRVMGEVLEFLDSIPRPPSPPPPPTSSRKPSNSPDWKPEQANVDVLFLSVRADRCLKDLGVKTVGDVMALRDYELLREVNMGKKSVAELRKSISEYLVGPWDDKGCLIYPPHEITRRACSISSGHDEQA